MISNIINKKTPPAEQMNNNNSNSNNNNSIKPEETTISTPNISNLNVRERLNMVKNNIPFLNNATSVKLVEFWKAWFQSIPSVEEVRSSPVTVPLIFDLSTSANMSKLIWRCSGPQSAFIQKMVDFFWIVGTPEIEIERLNDIGASINPTVIGSWITMSNKGGMDGGWYFPVQVELPTAMEAADVGDSKNKLNDWLQSNGINNVLIVGRDMGAHPPRQTEYKFLIPGNNFEEKLSKVLSVFDYCQSQRIPNDALDIIREKPKDEIYMNIVVSSLGFVQIGLICPSPDESSVNKLCSLCGSSYDSLHKFQDSLGVGGPSFVEYQFLMKGFGYGVYKEGFDVFFHYKAGEES
jgi:mannose/fructose/N-acetylgalactosamine-specific phosphotransferase system component IIB